MRQIIDFHTHPFSDDCENMCFYKEGMPSDKDFFVSDLKKAGISTICGSVIEPNGTDISREGFSGIQRLNRHALKLQEELGEFYVPGVHVHPDYVRESCEELEYMCRKGVKLVGELVPYLQGWEDYSCKEFGEILDTVSELGMVLSYHSTDDEQMERMIKRHPRLTFVAAHPGDRKPYASHLDRMKKYANVYLDLSGTGLFRYGMLKYGVDKLGAERFLFGTDYPIVNPAMYVQAVEFEHITETERELIFCGNAKRLLNL